MNSIEWLIGRLKYRFLNNDTEESIFERAKEMHRQETIEAWDMGRFNIDAIGSGEEYYNETYKKWIMKGILKNTDKGWVVKYFDTGKAYDVMYCGESLPINPYLEKYYFLDEDAEGREVEFEIEDFWETGLEQVYKVAKLTKPKEENCCTPEGQIKRYVDCIGCDRKPKQERMYSEEEVIEFTMNMISQYVVGNTNIWDRDRLKETLLLKKL
jgi:hypothetical protein